MFSLEFFAALLIVIASVIDSFVFGFSYGTARVKVSRKIIISIAFIASVVMVFSFILGGFLGEIIPPFVTLIIAVTIIGGMGFFKFVFGIATIFRERKIVVEAVDLKNIIQNSEFKIQNCSEENKKILSTLFSAKRNPLLLDRDKNKIISLKESILVAIVLTIDGAGAALSLSSLLAWYLYIIIFAFAFFIKIFFMKSGHFFGTRVAKKSKINLSWLSGLILIGLAISMIFIF
ncbi:MAG: hypothetical protein FWE22_05020 [Firmicutes bacterium]|nr:hypothetical protein [Bacillota bacterium]